jgi:transcriptional regulator with XRE-family HTH domain
MRLSSYLTRSSLSQADFARAIGVGEAAVSKWARGLAMPRPRQMQRIAEVTGGEVGPADWYDLAPGPASGGGPTAAEDAA